MLKIFELVEITHEIVTVFEHLFPQLTNLPAPTWEELELMVTSPNSRIFLARIDGEIAGVAALGFYRTPSGLHAWIEDVVVDEAHRRQGIGEALTRTLIETARSLGAQSLSLTSRPAREAANRLYQQLGFVKWETNLYRFPL